MSEHYGYIYDFIYIFAAFVIVASIIIAVFVRKKKLDGRQKVMIAFLSIPFSSSIISMFHLVSFFILGNLNWMACILAITFEIGALASLISFSVMDRIKKTPIYAIFAILFLMQLIGNVYSSFEYTSFKMMENPQWLDTLKEFINTTVKIFGGEKVNDEYIKYILACFIGMPIPLISISFIKSLVDYVDTEKPNKPEEPAPDDTDETTDEPVIVEEEQTETKTDQSEDGDGLVVKI